MCLIAFALAADPRYPLILVGNRDEFHDRPAQTRQWWNDAPDIAGGRDLQAGGTWQNRWPTEVEFYESEWARFKAA